MCKQPGCRKNVIVVEIGDKKAVMCEYNYKVAHQKRPYLIEQYYVNQISECLNSPDFVYRNLQLKSRYCFYKENYKLGDKAVYVKVVLALGRECTIISSYHTDNIKEAKFNKPICNPLIK
jgi:hypothetical protein